MSYLVVKLDKQLNILEALELSTHGLATQRAHEFIDAGFCARVVDKPLDPIAWFQEMRDSLPARPGPKPLMLEAQGHTSTPPEAVSMGLPTPLPLTSRVHIKRHQIPVRSIKYVTKENPCGCPEEGFHLTDCSVPFIPQQRRVIIRHGIFN
jgi:hypothetical protein